MSPLGRPVRVGLFEHDPDAFNCFRQMPRKRCVQPGAEVEIISAAMDILGWEWEIVDTQKEYGVLNDFGNLQPDGNFRWIYLMFVFFIVAVLKFAIGLLVDCRPVPRTNLLSSSMLESFGLMVKQRVAVPTSSSMKLLEAFLITSMMFVGQYYQTSMNSKLTAPPASKVPFLHQSEMLTLFEKGEMHPTYYFDVKMEGSSPKNQERINAYWQKHPLVIHSLESGITEEIRKGGVFFSTYDVDLLPYAVSSWDRKEKFTVIRDTTGILSYVAFGFSISNKKLCRHFNEALMQILPGVPQMTLGPGYARKKPPEDTNAQIRKTTLTLRCHLEQLFIIFGILLVVSCVSFGVEQLIYRSQTQVRKAIQSQMNRYF